VQKSGKCALKYYFRNIAPLFPLLLGDLSSKVNLLSKFKDEERLLTFESGQLRNLGLLQERAMASSSYGKFTSRFKIRRKIFAEFVFQMWAW